MSELLHPASGPRPLPHTAIHIRPGTLADIPFMDALQKQHTRQVGWMPRAQFEGKIAAGHVLIAEESGQSAVGGGQEREEDVASLSSLPTAHCQPPTPVGYLIGNDQYFKRDDVGIIYQMNVLPGRQRGLVGASLLKAQFERSAYGCRLYCCWCAQDIAANRFWEAMGFVPLAFRTGSRTKGRGANGKQQPRVHIFWQKRIRSGDTGDVSRGGTPWWFPSQTGGGSIREDRIVLPIPPGVHWSDEMPTLLPGADVVRGKWKAMGDEGDGSSSVAHRLALSTKTAPSLAVPREYAGEWTVKTKPQVGKSAKRGSVTTEALPGTVAATPVMPAPAKAAKPQRERIHRGGLHFGEPVAPTDATPAKDVAETRYEWSPQPASSSPVEGVVVDAVSSPKPKARETKAKGTKPKNDPRLVTAARELRDRWLEQVNETPLIGQAKYDVTRAITAAEQTDGRALLAA